MGHPSDYDEFEQYRKYLRSQQEDNVEEDKQSVVDAINQELRYSPAYQPGAKRNGNSQPIVAIRKDTNKCKVTVLPGDEMYIGDLIEVFGEHWLCMEMYEDEYGIRYGEIWMCNHIFFYQDHSLAIINKYAIVDDGSYSKSGDKAIVVTDNTYTCYVSIDAYSTSLYVDKRLALDVILNAKGETILEVGKIAWIDITSKNYGKGSHLMQFRLKNDVYNPETDNLQLKICDYKAPSGDDQSESNKKYLIIKGRETIRIGTSRKYSVTGVDEFGNDCAVDDVVWGVSAPNGVSFSANGNECQISVDVDDKLVGEIIKITCSCLSKEFDDGNKEVAVMSIG